MMKSRVYDFLNDIAETRTCCGFRENMIREANKPCDAVALGWLVCGIFESSIQKCMKNTRNTEYIEHIVQS